MAYHQTPAKVPTDGKKIYYRSDGTGRDTYISKTNGGFMSQSMLQNLEPRKGHNFIKMHFLTASNSNLMSKPSLAVAPKTKRYWGDGSGRDNFVIANDGGQCTPYRWQDQFDLPFQRGLRNYPTQPQPVQVITDPKMRRVQSATFFRQLDHGAKLAEPKKPPTPKRNRFIPTINGAHKLYKSYQTPEYQTKAKITE